MKRITTTAMGLAALVAMLVLGVFSAGSAQAHTFLWTGATPGLLLILADGPQIFKVTAIGGPEVICKHAHFDGLVKSESESADIVLGNYTGCSAFGSGVSVSAAEYEISAEETVSVINKTITIEAPGLCRIHIQPAGNANLAKIRYLVDPNSSSLRILAHAEVTGITSTTLNLGGGEVLCGKLGTNTTGTYRGLLLAWVDSPGTLKWS
jgi:hypothetical protein